jgi:hypothetical protein
MKEPYRVVNRKRVPKLCQCGGEMDYAVDFGLIWSTCKKCTPVVKVEIKRSKVKS